MKQPPIVDLHQDISYYYVMNPTASKFPRRDFSEDVPGRHGDIPKFKRANVRLVFASIFCLLSTVAPEVSRRLKAGYDRAEWEAAYTTRGAATNALEHMKVYYALEQQHPGAIRIARRREDLEPGSRKAGVGFLVALEGAYALEESRDLDLYYSMGLRSLQLSWNFDSKYCASCMSTRDYGLTGDGEELVDRCNALGVVIDLAHASPRTHADVARRSRLPVINSHSNARSLRDMSRNLDDEAYESIRRRGGVVGSIVDVTMTGGRNDVARLADHVMYVYEKFGRETIAVGTDFFGLLESVSGIEDITKMSSLFRELSKRGMSEKDIALFAHGNAMRVVKENAERWR